MPARRAQTAPELLPPKIIQRLDYAGLGQMRSQMAFVKSLAGCIDDQHQMIAVIRHHQVIENAARAVGQHRITLPPRRNSQYVARQQGFERLRRVHDAAGARTQRDLPHVRDVEQTGGCARVQVLLDDAGSILHRHVITCERHHAPAEAQVQCMKRRALEFARRRRLTHPAVSFPLPAHCPPPLAGQGQGGGRGRGRRGQTAPVRARP